MDNLYTLQKLFGDRAFRVRDYQRGYAWEEPQCKDLLEDLELLEGNSEHFVGPIQALGCTVEVPMRGQAIGQQLHWLKEQLT